MSEVLVNATAAAINSAKSNLNHIKGIQKSGSKFIQTIAEEGLRNSATAKGVKPLYKFAGKVMDKIV